MRRIWICAAAMLASVAIVGLGAESPSGLTVRLYNSARLPATDLLGAERAAAPILRDAGLNVSLRQCGGPALPGAVVDGCNDKIGPHEFVVRIIDAPRVSLTIDSHVFGVAYLAENTHRGRFITLYSDRIATAASRVEVEPGTLLGRVLAHEVGHLLLGNHQHGDSGVMRAKWSDELLQREGAKDWRFSMTEASTMQQWLASRREGPAY